MEILGGSSLEEMVADKTMRYALVKLLEIIDEASIKISLEFK
jgi:uncharacterized protein with HEPN domain